MKKLLNQAFKKYICIAISFYSLNGTAQKEERNYNKGVANSIDRIWELTSEYKRGTFKISEYQPIYVIPFKWTDNPNRQPISLNPNRPIPEYKDFQNIETEFQVSLKSKIIQGMFSGKGDLWIGFTQVSYFQIYNTKLSRMFRETNYEPEVIFTYPLNLSAGDFKMKMIGLSLNHQSNGKEEVNSRSWNRLILMGAFEYKNWTMETKFWYRLSEDRAEDDNHHIEKYIGKSEFQFSYQTRKYIFVFTHRNNLNFNTNRGFSEFSFIRPIFGNVKMISRLSYGYGESMIDYNHKQTSFALGFVIADF